MFPAFIQEFAFPRTTIDDGMSKVKFELSSKALRDVNSVFMPMNKSALLQSVCPKVISIFAVSNVLERLMDIRTLQTLPLKAARLGREGNEEIWEIIDKDSAYIFPRVRH